MGVWQNSTLLIGFHNWVWVCVATNVRCWNCLFSESDGTFLSISFHFLHWTMCLALLGEIRIPWLDFSLTFMNSPATLPSAVSELLSGETVSQLSIHLGRTHAKASGSSGSRGPWRPGPHLAPQISSIHAVFRQFKGKNPYFSANFGLRAPHLVSKLRWPPWPKS